MKITFSPSGFTAKSTCSRDIIDSAWIGSLGYTYKIQEPNWTNLSLYTYNLPVGSTVDFFCMDADKRPKQDDSVWINLQQDFETNFLSSHSEFRMMIRPTV